ncbi:MAG TPA: hypothetical protein VHE14_03700 [Solirubrobacteraceae bacterium]|nr:hypothetical protein [Solirubrobacteraceae bacterium]
MRNNPIQATLALLVSIGLIYLVVEVAGNKWYEWVIFGVIVMTGFGAAVAINHRKYPTRKRAYTRQSHGSETKFRDDEF